MTSSTRCSNLVAVPIGMQAVPRFVPTSSTFFHENISTALFPLPLIQEEQLSFNGERMYAKYWLTASERLSQDQCGKDN